MADTPRPTGGEKPDGPDWWDRDIKDVLREHAKGLAASGRGSGDFLDVAADRIEALEAEITRLRELQRGGEDWQVCPVCGGTSRVPIGFYNIGRDSTSITTEDQCRSCVKGLVVRPSPEEASPVGEPDLDKRPRLKGRLIELRMRLAELDADRERVNEFMRGEWYAGMKSEGVRRDRHAVERFGRTAHEAVRSIVEMLLPTPTGPETPEDG